ncbi:MAG: hypothetical protein A2289_25200 [Deltaproteobacteria bacterium RIFOXYA12_FULL_58_15]|nr:MAG: hypothetical protein A2289_25200 [Deltaproteobacteria bacterium RIFOXYA12_FULL_58_15]OGR13296.1 MAG: hypothetical protein A2341_16180 [Deltaproteobacteria bacterium RIFOXYB12_FULL_58_9]
MLTTDQVRVRHRKGNILVAPLKPAERSRLTQAAEAYVSLVKAHVGGTRGELDTALDRVPHLRTDYKLLKGLRKLLFDRCHFEVYEDADPPKWRRETFAHAAKVRRELSDGDTFDRPLVLQRVAAQFSTTAEILESQLFADLKANQRLTSFDGLSAPMLLDTYEIAQRQAVLLRATRVVVHLRCADPSVYRLFFSRLKFRRLLHTVHPCEGGGFRIDIDGPFSLFSSVTKYGLQLALMLPLLQRASEWQLDADVLWGKERIPMRYHLEGTAPQTPGEGTLRLRDEVQNLIESFERLDSPWQVSLADDLLELPGIGMCVPDVVFQQGKHRVFLEVMGYWSRDAVWKRVELVEAGLPNPIIFAVSSRLRVSEEALDTELPGALYVYKGVISAATVEERLNGLVGATASSRTPPRLNRDNGN